MAGKSRSGGPVRAALVGAGHRGVLYASYALAHPDELEIVAVVDPDPVRRAPVTAAHGIGAGREFETVEELIAAGDVADSAINATMDSLHVATTIPLLEAGYDVLVEKPVATSAADLLALASAAERAGRVVMVCHVLRFAPFYAAVKARVAAGEIGELITVELTEHVTYHHMAVGYVRGKWNDEARCGSSMLMAKSCHDLDLLSWFKSGVSPTRVTSAGGRMFFRPEKAPAGAGTRCLTDCAIEESCPYSARKHYVDAEMWKFYAWTDLEDLGREPTREEMLASLAGDNPFGRCVWHCDNTVVDHQSVVVEFADGSTATHSMVGNSAKGARSVRLIGAEGEIDGVMEDGAFAVRHFDPAAPGGFTEEVVRLDVSGQMHGGGDLRLVADFVTVLRGGEPSLSTTALADSVNGHLIGFAADEGRRTGSWITLADHDWSR
jgi:predicted dehydrogenase